MTRFAITGAAGYVAARHLKAIKETGGRLVTAFDPAGRVGVLDDYFPDAICFDNPKQFERRLEILRDQTQGSGVEYVSICSPTHQHDAQIRLALKLGAHAISEKPIVVSPLDLRKLADLESLSAQRIYTVLQLRLHPSLIALRCRLDEHIGRNRPRVIMSYIAPRGTWYHSSWKGDEAKSGGMAMNIGVHLFDLLIWLFGSVERSEVHLSTHRRLAGALEMERASVRWYLSIDEHDLPEPSSAAGYRVFRSIMVDGEEIDFSDGPADLHTRVYEEILKGMGCGIDDARPSIELVHLIRQSATSNGHRNLHPMLVA
jgi:UDP-N-acetyl-2-amino-2-deoxyglucuronate dehydrogenase